jgi:hypothetical protein
MNDFDTDVETDEDRDQAARFLGVFIVLLIVCGILAVVL